MNHEGGGKPPAGRRIFQWFDSGYLEVDLSDPAAHRIDWVRCLPFLALHALCLLVFWVGFSWAAFGVALFLLFARVFFVTAFYHRYFSHRTYRTSRAFQFVMAVLGNTAVQRGALWWAAHHRHHHATADREGDVHSPKQHGFLWSHIGWIMTKANYLTRFERIGDWVKFPELVFLNRFDIIVPAVLAFSLYALGSLLDRFAPSLGTSGAQMVVWGFIVSTVALYHLTFMINSLTHMVGRQRYRTGDESRNSLLLALLTFGEGWHNNHHRYPVSVRQGFYWWEIDITYYLLKALSWTGLIWELRSVPAVVLRPEKARNEANPPGTPHPGPLDSRAEP